MFFWKSKLLLIAATAGLATWSGYDAERRTSDAAGKPKTTVRSVVKRLMTPAAERAGVDRLEELRQAIGRSYPSRQESAALWAVVRAFSVEEVKAALEALPKESDRRVNGEIASMLVYRWAQLEPEAAAAATLAAGDESRRFDFHIILGAWSQRDPDAAIRWGRECGNDMARYAAMQVAAAKWVSDDPATALSRARAEFPEARHHVFRSLLDKFSATPESRQQLFSLLWKEVDPKKDPEFFQRLAPYFGPSDPAGLEAIAGEMAAAGASQEQIQQFRDGIPRGYGPDHFRELLEKSDVDSNLTAERRRGAYGTWSRLQPESALQWAESKGEAGLVAHAVGSAAEQLLETDWTPGRVTHTPWATAVRQQFPVWQRIDATAAEAWLATMPGDIRKLVATPTPTLQNNATR